LSKVGGFAYVVAVLKGSPAEQAGVREGDFIEYVQKIPSRDLSIYETEQLVNGAPGTSVELRIFRRGNSRRFNVGRAKLAQPPVESRIEEPGVGYIKITSLADGKANEVKTAISGLVSKGAQKLVLDLRGAANGKLQEGVSVANLFVGSGVLARVTGKNDAEVKSFAADPSKVVFQGPLVVVVDRSTAGPAEAIAAAVINQNRGEVVGERTFGAGSEQQLFSLADGGAFLITTAKYAPPSGKPFMDEPINPTVKVDRPLEADLLLPDTSDDDENVDEAPPTPVEPPPPAVEDIQLKKAVELLKNSAAKGASANKRAALRKPGGSRFAQAA
jgi:carboxyl-terminal processing protease